MMQWTAVRSTGLRCPFENMQPLACDHRILLRVHAAKAIASHDTVMQSPLCVDAARTGSMIYCRAACRCCNPAKTKLMLFCYSTSQCCPAKGHSPVSTWHLTSDSVMANSFSSCVGTYIRLRSVASSPTSRRMLVSWFAVPSPRAALYTSFKGPYKASLTAGE